MVYKGPSYLRIKTKVLFLFEEEIEDKFPHKVRVQCVVDNFCPTKLEERQTESKRQSAACKSNGTESGKLLV